MRNEIAIMEIIIPVEVLTYFVLGYLRSGESTKRQINNFVKKINKIYISYFKNNNVYYSVIPEKNYYLDTNKYKKYDYANLFNKIYVVGFLLFWFSFLIVLTIE